MLIGFDHVTVRCVDLDRTRRFYTDVLGLRLGPRPAFGIPGHWLYLADRAAVHLLEGTAQPRRSPGIAGFDHIAFDGRDRRAIEVRLRRAGIVFRLTALPDGSALQMFVHDPDGTSIEIVFRAPADAR